VPSNIVIKQGVNRLNLTSASSILFKGLFKDENLTDVNWDPSKYFLEIGKTS
jgi:hypothetical protein